MIQNNLKVQQCNPLILIETLISSRYLVVISSILKYWDVSQRSGQDYIFVLLNKILRCICTCLTTLEKNEVPGERINSLREYVAKRQIEWAKHRHLTTGIYEKAKALLKQCQTQWLKMKRRKYCQKFSCFLLFPH